MSTEFEVVYYVSPTGKTPFLEWANNLESVARSTVFSRIGRVKRGLLGDCKSVGSGVLELRLSFGPGYRIYFAIQDQTIVVLLCGGDKKTQSSDIAKAKKYLAEIEV